MRKWVAKRRWERGMYRIKRTEVRKCGRERSRGMEFKMRGEEEWGSEENMDEKGSIV